MAKKASTKPSESKEVLLDYLRQMHEIRNFEEKVYDLLREGTIKGASHLYAGQEAVAVGCDIASLEDRDVIAAPTAATATAEPSATSTQRRRGRQEHWNKMMAELMGKATGYCKGRGGSMHIADVEKRQPRLDRHRRRQHPHRHRRGAGREAQRDAAKWSCASSATAHAIPAPSTSPSTWARRCCAGCRWSIFARTTSTA